MGNINFQGATLLIAGFITLVVGGIILGWCWMICFTRRITGSSSIVAVAPPTTTTTTTITATTSSNSTSAIKDQVDPKRVSSTPSFVVSSAVKKDKLECAVCLTELKDGEKGRLLSRCGHSFHASCIDTRFQCPLCRSPVLL